MLCCVTLRYIMLRNVTLLYATPYVMLRYVTLRYSMLRNVTLIYATLRYVAGIMYTAYLSLVVFVSFPSSFLS